MRVVVALALGCLSGFLLYMIAALASGKPSTAMVAITFLGGWAISTYALLRGARTVSKVFSRGALLGAAEWIAFAAAGVIFSGRVLAETQPSSGTGLAGAAAGAGFVAFLQGAVAVFMAVVCLIVFAIAYFTGREMADTTGTPTKKCPECAEMVQAEARRCKHCGAALVLPSPQPTA
jgi:hypothetical protein